MTSAALRRFTHLLATGAWATPLRLRDYGLMLLAGYVAAAVLLLATGRGDTDFAGRPIGADFGMVWTAGQAALEGRPAEVYSLAAQAASQAEAFGPAAGFTPWHYPPILLLVAAPLAMLPYLAALALWQAAGFVGYAASLRACVAWPGPGARRLLLLGAAAPAVFVNLAHGQNGFLTTALLAGGLALLRPRPVLAGALFALLAYKPQFCLVLPGLLIAGRHWRAIGAAVAASLALALTTLALFGPDVWTAFVASLGDATRLTLETGAAGWEKIQSPHAALRLLGASYRTGMVVQATLSLIAMAVTAQIWRSSADQRLKEAVVFAAVLVAAPYSIDYDMVALTPAIALLAFHGARSGFARGEVSFLALVAAAPFLARPAATALDLPLGAATTFALFLWAARRALSDAHDSLALQPPEAVRTSPGPRPPSER